MKTTRKQMHQRLKEIGQLLPKIKEAVKAEQQNVSRLEKERTELTEKLNEDKKTPGVSDHALLRYIERKYQVDMQTLRDEILTPDRMTAIKLGANSIKVEGLTFTISNGCVTTCVKRGSK